MLYLRNKKNVAKTWPTIHKIATIALHDVNKKYYLFLGFMEM